jgi:uncharacterized protein YndB with AHSA1/START domain
MPDTSPNSPPPVFRKTVIIQAPQSQVWLSLTAPAEMQAWMAQADLRIETNWAIGGPFLIRGDLHGLPFENKGTVLAFQPETLLRYTHLSSVSHLPDIAESYAQIEFKLESIDKNQTRLTVEVSRAPTQVIHKHLAYYWNVTLEVLKRRLEGSQAPLPGPGFSI